jgi:iron complex outermembrane receptor protein
LNADAFYQKFKGFISVIQGLQARNDPNGTVADTNALLTVNGDAIVKGGEISADAVLPYGFKVHSDITYVDAKWDNARLPGNVYDPATGLAIIPKGQQVAYVTRSNAISAVPPWAVNASVEYSRALTRQIQFFINGLYSYKGSKVDSTLRKPDFSAYGIVDFSLGLRQAAGKWEVSAYARNLFDDSAITQRSDPDVATFWTSGYNSVTVVPPRQIGVTATYRF